jgi:hypothetical protein
MLTPCYVTSNPSSIVDNQQEFLLVNETPIVDIASQNSSNQYRNRMTQPDIGSNRTFWTLNHSSLAYYQIEARLLSVGDHCYIYMEDVAIEFLGQNVATERGETYRDEFDSTIYHYVVDLAGNPDGVLGDIDGDPRVIILLSTNPVSYYGFDNEFNRPNSNLCEMVYIRYTTSYMLGVISHEFHHLILFNHDGDETPFIFESLAQFAAKYTGSVIPWDNITWGVSEFLLHPEDSLIYWTPNTGGAEAEVDYGSAYLFGLYLAEQFGVDFMRNLVSEEEDGAEGVMATLDDMGYNITFNELYLDWITALAIDVPSIADGQYGFHEANASIHRVGIVSDLPYELNDLSLRCYGFNVRRLVAPPDYFVIDIAYLPVYTLGLSIAYHDDEGWHIQQTIQTGGSLVEVVEGSSIDNAYIMTTHLYEDTPSGEIFYGHGVSTTVSLSILEEFPETPGFDLLPIGLVLGSIVVAIVIIIIWKRKGR